MHDRHDETCPVDRCPDTAHGLAALAQAMRVVTLPVDDSDDGSPLDELVRAAADRVPGATEATVTMLRHGRLSTVASTSDAATRADALQHGAGGPCAGAVLDETARRSDDGTCAGRRWQVWGALAHEEAGVRSALSYRLAVLDHSETTAALNIYSEQPDAFDKTSVNTGLVLATHASLLITAMLARDRADHLARALKSNREIGVAMGILMQRHRLTREQAFDILCIASQDANRKLADIATEVADTGILTIRRWPGSTTPTCDGSAGDWAPVQDGAPGAGSSFSSVLDTPGGMGARTAASEPATSAVRSVTRTARECAVPAEVECGSTAQDVRETAGGDASMRAASRFSST